MSLNGLRGGYFQIQPMSIPCFIDSSINASIFIGKWVYGINRPQLIMGKKENLFLIFRTVGST